MLYLVSTPIGNLKDLSPRAVEVMQECDLILCEDKRHSGPMLRNSGITTPLHSYHKFSEAKQLDGIIEKLKSGSTVALISDAGTPVINDPGERLVAACCASEIPVTAVPGPCALIQALVLSGLPTTPFQFCGFVPRKEGERRRFLATLLCYPGTTIVYESPKRVVETIGAIAVMAAERRCCLARELTKKFEECIRGTASELHDLLLSRDEIKGECVLVIEGESTQKQWNTTPPLQLVSDLQSDFKLSLKEAQRLAAELSGISKRELYRQQLDAK